MVSINLIFILSDHCNRRKFRNTAALSSHKGHLGLLGVRVAWPPLLLVGRVLPIYDHTCSDVWWKEAQESCIFHEQSWMQALTWPPDLLGYCTCLLCLSFLICEMRLMWIAILQDYCED